MFDIDELEESVGVHRFNNDENKLLDFEVDLESAFNEAINDGCRGFSSLNSEYKMLRLDVQSDILFVESMERQMAIEMMKDKIELRRGIRGLNPTFQQQSIKRLTNAERMEALRYVKDRVKKLRQARKQQQHKKKRINPANAKENIKRVSKMRKPSKYSSVFGRKEKSSVLPLQARNIQSTN